MHVEDPVPLNSMRTHWDGWTSVIRSETQLHPFVVPSPFPEIKPMWTGAGSTASNNRSELVEEMMTWLLGVIVTRLSEGIWNKTLKPGSVGEPFVVADTESWITTVWGLKYSILRSTS